MTCNHVRLTQDASITRLFVSETLVRVALDTVQVHGGHGFMAEYEVERALRDAVGSTIYSGTSEMSAKHHRKVVGVVGAVVCATRSSGPVPATGTGSSSSRRRALSYTSKCVLDDLPPLPCSLDHVRAAVFAELAAEVGIVGEHFDLRGQVPHIVGRWIRPVSPSSISSVSPPTSEAITAFSMAIARAASAGSPGR